MDDALRALKAELYPIMKRANQRLYRLEQANLTSSHGYRAASRVTGRSDKPRFSIGGGTLEELQDERVRIQNFLDYQTSTVKGTRDLLGRYAEQMRVPYSRNAEQLVSNSSQFFRLSNRVREYVRNTPQARHISSDEVFLGISRAVNTGVVDLSNIDFDNFNITDEQMDVILGGSGAQTARRSLFDELDDVGGDWTYGSTITFDEYDPRDF